MSSPPPPSRRRNHDRDRDGRRRDDEDDDRRIRRSRREEEESRGKDEVGRRRRERRSVSPARDDGYSLRREKDTRRRSRDRRGGGGGGENIEEAGMNDYIHPDRRRIRQSSHTSSSKLSSLQATNTTAAAAGDDAPEVEKEKEKVNFSNTGLLAAESNTINGVVLKYSEPAEARKPPASQKWRLFVFKDKEIVETLDLCAASCWLVGRDRAVADMPVDHPSCSKQHAVLQFRFVSKVGEFGDKVSRVRPYIIDLESANGTYVNKERIPASRYVELMEKDMIVFGFSTREYILMLDDTK